MSSSSENHEWNPTPRELSHVFGKDVLPILKRLVKECKVELRELLELEVWVSNKAAKLSRSHKMQEAFVSAAHVAFNITQRKLRALWAKDRHERTIHEIEMREIWKHKIANGEEPFEAKLARAKEKPISDIIDVNRAGFAKCVYHEEKSPSMKYYKDNHCHSFCCGKSSDVVDIAMAIWNVDFKEAVRRLS